MKTALQKLRRVLNTELGFFLLVLLFCFKRAIGPIKMNLI